MTSALAQQMHKREKCQEPHGWIERSRCTVNNNRLDELKTAMARSKVAVYAGSEAHFVQSALIRTFSRQVPVQQAQRRKVALAVQPQVVLFYVLIGLHPTNVTGNRRFTKATRTTWAHYRVVLIFSDIED